MFRVGSDVELNILPTPDALLGLRRPADLARRFRPLEKFPAAVRFTYAHQCRRRGIFVEPPLPTTKISHLRRFPPHSDRVLNRERRERHEPA